MEKTLFTAYGRLTDFYGQLHPELRNVPADHVFIESVTGENWRLFGGQDVVSPSTPSVGSAQIQLEWFKLVHGDESQVAGITVYVTGTCQNAANRLLVLGHGDVSKAHGNALVILAYGKYGFEVNQFVERVRSTAASLNGMIPESEVDAVIREIEGDQDSELAILERGFDERFGGDLCELPEGKLKALKEKYLEYHDKRERMYFETPRNSDPVEFQRQYGSRMKPLLLQYIQEFQGILGDEVWSNRLKLPPVDVALRFLTGA